MGGHVGPHAWQTPSNVLSVEFMTGAHSRIKVQSVRPGVQTEKLCAT
jgi:hypothetical protein